MVVLGSNDNSKEEEEFLSTYSRSVTLIYLEDPTQFDLLNTSLKTSDGILKQSKINCNNLLVFIKSQNHKLLINVTESLYNLYNQLKNQYHLDAVVFVTVEHSEEDEAYDSLLLNISNERIFVVIPEQSQVRRWKVSDNQVHRSSYENWKIPPEHSTFSNRHLRVATINYPPVCMIPNVENISGIETVDGIEPNLLVIISEYLNFTFDYSQSRPGELWDGMIRMVEEKRVDIAIGDLYMFPDKPYEFSIPYKFNYEGFIVPAPQPFAKWTALIYSFSLVVWIVTLFSIVSAILVLRCLAKWTLSRFMRDAFFDDTLLCFSFVFGSFLGVAQPRQINSMVFRLFFFFWLLSAATIIPTVYRSGFISLMTSPPLRQQIKTIKELSASTLKKATIDIEFFKKSFVSFEQRLVHQLVNANITQMMHLIGTGNWAIEGDLDYLQYAIATHYPSSIDSSSLKFHVMKERFIPTRSCMILQKDSAIKVYIDRALQRLREAGLVEYYQSKFVKKLNKVKPPVQLVPFSLDHLQGAFYLLAFGAALSFLVFILEQFAFFLKTRKKS